MRCPSCGRNNPADAAFCAGCGASLAGACPDCGRPAPADARFCAGCGRRLNGPPPAEQRSPSGPPAPPEHLAEKARASRAALEGERKQVTVLFADVKGSMEIQEDLDPEDWHGLMDRFMRILADGVHRFEGTVDKFTGDGIMALFGAPVAHEDHARRACYSALHLVETIGHYADELRRARGLSFHARIGLNSGEVIVGTIGDDSHMEYTAVGHTVGLAQRMEALAEPGRAYLTEHTARLVAGYFRLRDLGPFTVKGAREPVGVSVVEGVGALRSAYDVARSRGLSRLVGRAEEMAALESALARAAAGQGQVVGVVGEAGVGKSRLCGEFTQSCQARGMTVWRAHGVSHGRGLPLLPAIEFLRQVFGITDADSPQAAREKVAGRLLLYDLLDPDSEELPVLFDFLEIPDPARRAPQMTPEARLRRLFSLLRRIAQRRSEREMAVVILLEDLHWFDPASLEFLEFLVESYPATRTLLLTNFRPEFHADWMRHSYYRQLPLATLDSGAVRELLRELLGTDGSLRELSDHILRRTGGNPFFVEEVVRNLLEEHMLEGAPGAYRLTRPLQDLRVPPTVQSLLSARIDRLSAADKEALQTAAVIGRTFSEPVLRRVTGRAADDFAASVRALGAAEFIHEEALFPVAEYRFWHPLTQEVAYGSLLGERRARLHAAVAGAIAEVDPDRADERAALLAQHWESAGEPLEAARWHARAAQRAGFRDMVEAERHWQATVRLLEDVPTSDETRALGMNARAVLARIAFRFGGDPAESVALLDQARALAEERRDTFGIGLALVAKGFVVFGHGHIDDCIELMTESVRRLEASGEPEAMAARALLAYPLSIRGPLPAVLRHADETAEQALRYPEMGQRLFALSVPHYNLFWRAWPLARMGRFAEAARSAEQAEAAGREASMWELVAWARPVQALVAFLSGDAGGVDHALETVRIADELGSAFHSVLALEGLGAAYLAAGQAAAARPPLTDALALARDRHVGLFEEASLLAYLADAHRSAGDEGAAVEAAEAAVGVARRQNAGVHECHALVAQARALRAAGGGAAREAIGEVVAAAHRTIERVGADAWSPFLAEEETWLAEVAR